MTLQKIIFALGVAGLFFSTSDVMADQLFFPSFELGSALTFDESSEGDSTLFWILFTDERATSTSELDTSMPRTGSQSAKLSLDEGNGFSGFFTDVFIAPGDVVDFSIFAAETTDFDGAGIELRIEWLDPTFQLIDQTPNVTPASLGTEYEQIAVSGTAPENALFARGVFAIQSFGAGVPQMVFADDAAITLNAVPEPSSMALTFVACLALLAHRRRK